MTLRPMPPANFTVRPGVRSDVSDDVIARWVPNLRAASDEDEATISIFDVIGKDIWGDGVTANRIAAALRQIGKRPVTVQINSPGGDVFEGLAIYNLLREHKAEVTVKVIGVAASAASYIAMAGDRIEIAKSAFFMIHNAWVGAVGAKEHFREVADWLEPFDGAMADIYEARTDVALDKIVEMMVGETWINGSQAVEMGFADDFLPRDQVETDPEDTNASARRIERAFDVLAARAGLSRQKGKALLAEIKGGVPGAAPTDAPEAVDIMAGLKELCETLRN